MFLEFYNGDVEGVECYGVVCCFAGEQFGFSGRDADGLGLFGVVDDEEELLTAALTD